MPGDFACLCVGPVAGCAHSLTQVMVQRPGTPFATGEMSLVRSHEAVSPNRVERGPQADARTSSQFPLGAGLSPSPRPLDTAAGVCKFLSLSACASKAAPQWRVTLCLSCGP